MDKFQRRWHKLKTYPQYLDALREGRKTFELRRNDRAFQVGDGLMLCPVDEYGYMSDFGAVPVIVTYIFSGDPRFKGLEPGYVVMSIVLERLVALSPAPTVPANEEGKE